jgi:hypothetical protein
MLKSASSIFVNLGYYMLGLITLILVIVFVLIPVALPLLLLWGFAIYTAQFVPSLGRPLSPQSVIFARDDFYGKPGHTINMAIGFDGKFGDISKNLAEKLYKDRVEAQFPELKQYLSRWMGFYFWKQDPHFSIDEHVTVSDIEIKSLEELDEKRYTMAVKPFIREKSLWEAVLYTNCNIEGNNIKTAAVLRIHHAMADGYSLLKIANALTDDKNVFENLPKPNITKLSALGMVWLVLKLCLRAPIDVLSVVLSSLFMEQHEWKIPQDNMKGEGHRAIKDMPLAEIREIGIKHGVRTTAVLFAALTGGIKKYMEVNGTTIPKRFTVMCPFPLPSHPDHLTNHM